MNIHHSFRKFPIFYIGTPRSINLLFFLRVNVYRTLFPLIIFFFFLLIVLHKIHIGYRYIQNYILHQSLFITLIFNQGGTILHRRSYNCGENWYRNIKH